MTITHKISIDLARHSVPAQIDAVQGDSGRIIALKLHTNGIPWHIPAGIGILIRYRKPDGIGGTYDTLPDGSCAFEIRDNVLAIALAPQVLTVPGKTQLRVLLTNGNHCISTFDIAVNVQPALQPGIEKSQHYVNLASFLVTPEGAEVGQYLKVLQTDSRGRVTRLGAANAAGGNELESIGAKIISGEIRSIVLLGDSITDGAGGSDYNGNFANTLSTNTEGYCWANAFQKFTRQRYGTTVQNKGMYGTVMATQKETALNFLTEKDFVIWLTGTNDRWDANGYKANLRAQLEAVKKKCAGLLVISNIPATEADEREKPFTMQQMDEIIMGQVDGFVPHFSMYQAFIEYCLQHGISLSDCFADHCHPNDLGYKIMFTLLCRKLGLPLDPYTDYGYNGLWWNDILSGTEGVLASNEASADASAFNQTMIKTGVTVPCVFMPGYNADARTTSLSGTYITKMNLLVNTAGTITFGTVDLNTVGQAPVYRKRKTVEVSQTGLVTLELGLKVGAHETLAFHSTDDTGGLAYLVGNTYGSSELQFWIANSFKNNTPENSALYGTIYGYGGNGSSSGGSGSGENPDSGEDVLGELLMDSTDDYGTPTDYVFNTAEIVPLVLMDGYDSDKKSTALSGAHISKLTLHVAEAGSFTFGTVDLKQVGSADPVFTKSEVFTVTDTGMVDFWLNWDLGANETLAVQSVSDTGNLSFAVAIGDLSVWKSSAFAIGTKDANLILYGKIYGSWNQTGEGAGSGSTDDPGAVILDSTDEYDSTHDQMFTTEGTVPCVLMDGYDAAGKTTALSGKTITKVHLYVGTAGTITFGTVNVRNCGQAGMAYVSKKEISVSQTGFVDIWLNMPIGANETLAVQSVSDTGRLAFDVRGGDLFIWQAKDFEAGAKSTDLILIGTIYGR